MEGENEVGFPESDGKVGVAGSVLDVGAAKQTLCNFQNYCKATRQVF